MKALFIIITLAEIYGRHGLFNTGISKIHIKTVQYAMFIKALMVENNIYQW